MSAVARESNPTLEQLSAQNFKRLADLVQTYSGIKMPPSKRTMLEGRLRRRMRATHHGSINEYCRHLFEQDGLAGEMVDLIDAVTTNKTEFFRERTHFDFVAHTVVPTILSSGRHRIRAWSSACSTGAEPYTLAMVLSDAIGNQRGVDYEILATDLSTAVLREALAGCYDQGMIDPVPQDMRRRYLMRAKDRGSREVRIVPQLRSKVAFGRLNLMDERFPLDEDFDLIFCRNVLIYFDKTTQAKVLGRLCSHLRPGGFLFLGHSESITGIKLPLATVANTVFQRV